MASRSSKEWTDPPCVPSTHYVEGNVYTSSEIFNEEKDKIFEKLWQFVCHESEIPLLYDFKTLDFLGKPILIQRGGDGVIRSFLNVCSHRGAKIVHELSGNKKIHRCFYHLWTYNDKGACIGMPRDEGYSKVNLDKNDLGLRLIKTDCFNGLIFINFDEKSGTLKKFLKDSLFSFEKTLSSEDLEVIHYSKSIIKCNWKAWQETNLDLYHEWMHVLLRKTQIDISKMKDRKVKSFINGHTAVGGLKASYKNYLGMKSRKEDMTLPGLEASDFFFVDIFPNTALLARGTVIRIDTVTPIDEKTSIIEWRGLGLKSDTPEQRILRYQHHNQYWGPFGRNVPEDAFAAEACEMGFRSRASLYQIIAREENLSAQDDGMLRVWYSEWSRLLNRSYSKTDKVSN